MREIESFFLDKSDYLGKLDTGLFPTIRGRGFKIGKHQTPCEIFSVLPKIKDHITKFYKMMQKYSVRLLLHDLLNSAPLCEISELTHYCSTESVKKFLSEFEKFGMAKILEDDHVQINFDEKLNTGWILEWFLSSLLDVEFNSVSIFNAGLSGTQSGGDFDILASWLGKLLYVESKSAPPKGIHNPEISAFFKRIQSIKPDIAIFVNDTHLRVKDKIVLMFEEELIKLRGLESLKSLPIRRVKEQIFQLNHYVYIMNTKRSIQGNLSMVFHDYLQNNLPIKEIFLNDARKEMTDGKRIDY